MTAPWRLGSDLLAAALNSVPRRSATVPTACAAVDDALDGGFEYGSIISVAGAEQADKTLIALHAVASHLLSPANTEVVFVYTSESDLPIQLHDIILDRLASNKQANPSSKEQYGTATKLLDRVRLMRAFDFVGVLESIGEIGEAWSKIEKARADRKLSNRGRREILSSQDEDLDISEAERSDNDGGNEGDHLDSQGIGMVVVDNIASVMNVEISKDQDEGQSLLTSFFRSLQHLTYHYRMCTIVINTTVTTSSYQSQLLHKPVESISIFPTTSGTPGLGQTYAHFVDLSAFVSDVPKTRNDAEIAYGGKPSRIQRWQPAKVFEIIDDRSAHREGKWGAFELDGARLDSYN